MELVSLLVSASSPWLLQGQGRGSGELSVKPRGLEHLLAVPIGAGRVAAKTAAEIKQFGVDEALCDVSCLKLRVCEHGWQVSSWVRAALEEENYAAEAQEIIGILESQNVKGSALLDLTYQWLVDKPYNIAGGPAGKLA